MDKGKEKRIAALNETQEKRRQKYLQRTEKAIIKLSQMNQKLSFANIAREAKVSISYLYKYPEIKKRIQYLRRQQEENAKPVKPQLRSEKSSQTIINQLRGRIKRLESEKKELSKQNEALTGRLYATGNTQDIIARLNAENSQFKAEIKQLRTELASTKNELSKYKTQEFETKVTPISKAQSSEISEAIKSELKSLGIKLNSTLRKIIKANNEQTVLNAIEALKEANATGEVKKPGGWLASAIENGWTKAESIPQQQTVSQPKIFTASPKPEKELISVDKLKALSTIFSEEDESF
jgi:predicted nuclease with TOPRIM domain